MKRRPGSDPTSSRAGIVADSTVRQLAVLANQPDDYERLGLSPTSIEPWEDGARTDNSAGTYEWWYFDAHLADGAKLVVAFMNKDIAQPQRPLSPLLRLDLDLPDGRHFEKLVHYPAGDWSAARDCADVRLGANRFTGDLHRYRIQATAEGISVDITLTGEVPAWRPSTGYMLFGADRSLEFAWLPSVPQGAVTITYSVGGEQHETTGVGYHDHNWGNVGLMKVVHDWYWARGQAGPYSVIASYITAARSMGSSRFRFSCSPVTTSSSATPRRMSPSSATGCTPIRRPASPSPRRRAIRIGRRGPVRGVVHPHARFVGQQDGRQHHGREARRRQAGAFRRRIPAIRR